MRDATREAPTGARVDLRLFPASSRRSGTPAISVLQWEAVEPIICGFLGRKVPVCVSKQLSCVISRSIDMLKHSLAL